MEFFPSPWGFPYFSVLICVVYIVHKCFLTEYIWRTIARKKMRELFLVFVVIDFGRFSNKKKTFVILLPSKDKKHLAISISTLVIIRYIDQNYSDSLQWKNNRRTFRNHHRFQSNGGNSILGMENRSSTSQHR